MAKTFPFRAGFCGTLLGLPGFSLAPSGNRCTFIQYGPEGCNYLQDAEGKWRKEAESERIAGWDFVRRLTIFRVGYFAVREPRRSGIPAVVLGRRNFPNLRTQVSKLRFWVFQFLGDRKSTRLNSSHLGISYA